MFKQCLNYNTGLAGSSFKSSQIKVISMDLSALRAALPSARVVLHKNVDITYNEQYGVHFIATEGPAGQVCVKEGEVVLSTPLGACCCASLCSMLVNLNALCSLFCDRAVLLNSKAICWFRAWRSNGCGHVCRLCCSCWQCEHC